MKHKRKKSLNLLGKYKLSPDMAKTDSGKFAIKALKVFLTVFANSMGNSEQTLKQGDFSAELARKRRIASVPHSGIK